MRLARRHRSPCAVGAGLLAATGFAPLFWWPLALAALAVFFWLVRTAKTPKKAFKKGLLFGLGLYLGSLWWIGNAFWSHAPVPIVKPMAVPAVALLCAYLALYPALVGWAWQKLFPRNAVAGAGLFAALWLGAEVLREVVLYGFPWNQFGYVFADNLWLMQGAALGGVWGLTFLAALVAALLAMPTPKLGVPLALSVVAGLYGYGHLRLSAAEPLAPLGTVRLVQANIGQAHKWDPALRAEQLLLQVRLSRPADEAGAPEAIDAVIWPETAAAFFLDYEPDFEPFLAVAAGQGVLITGMPRMARTPDGTHFYNSIGTLDGTGTVQDYADKTLLVPFGEFIPLRRFVPATVSKLTEGSQDFSPAQVPPRLSSGGLGTALPLICYEAIFPAFVRRHAHGRDFLLNVTNDGWFSHTPGPAQHFAMARLRAVETGMSLVRVANTGITAVVDGYGRVVNRLEAEQQGVLDSPVLEQLARPPLFRRAVTQGS
jgi:apolipoprotein N-acyltransferase